MKLSVRAAASKDKRLVIEGNLVLICVLLGVPGLSNEDISFCDAINSYLNLLIFCCPHGLITKC